jgi:hypothetical protein
MSVVSGAARRRWATVAAGVAVLLAAPTAASAVADRIDAVRGRHGLVPADPASLLGDALASASVPHQGLAESRGGLAVPDVPRLGDVAAQLGETTRLRVWWSGPDAWRVDAPTLTGERDTYGGTELGFPVRWDYEDLRLTAVVGDPPLRLPREDDLLPPQVARRLLSGVGPADVLEPAPQDRVAGRRTVGLRIVPADPRSTIGAIDVQLEPASRLPLAVTVRDPAGRTALDSRFVDLALTTPDPAVLKVPAAPGASREQENAPDLVSRVLRDGAWALPDRLAGLPASEETVGGAAAYGTGLVRLVVLPLSPRLGARVLDATRAGAVVRTLPGGEVQLLTSGPISIAAARGSNGEHLYLISGLVTTDLLADVAGALFADPPPRRVP